MSAHKELKQLMESATAKGWEITQTASCHFKWLWPKNGGFFWSGKTISDCRAFDNIKKHMRNIERGTHRTTRKETQHGRCA